MTNAFAWILAEDSHRHNVSAGRNPTPLHIHCIPSKSVVTSHG